MTDSWADLVEKKAQIIIDQIVAARVLLSRNEVQAEGIDRPYLDLLRQLYQEEYPLAQLIDSSDLVARFEGRKITGGSAPTKVVAFVVSKLRTQIQVIAKAIAGLRSDVRWPDSLDPVLTGIAQGSLVIGVSIPPSRQAQLPAIPDPVLDSVRDSVRRVAVVAQYVRDDGVDEAIEQEIPDPAIRDTVLVAASNLAPTTQSGVDKLVLYEPGISDKQAIPLTSESRKILRRAVDQPVKASDTATFSGVVRAIDLDAKRFEIRHVKEIDGDSVRCIYRNVKVDDERRLLDREVCVHGRYEPVDGRPRLIEVVKLEMNETKRRAGGGEPQDILGIESTPGVCGGEPRIARTRISVWILEQARRLGTNEAELLQAYPALRAEDLANAWAYVRSHRQEIEEQISANEDA